MPFASGTWPLLFFLSIGLFNFAFVVFLTHSEARYNGPIVPLMLVATCVLWYTIASRIVGYFFPQNVENPKNES